MFQMDEGIKASLDALSEAKAVLNKYNEEMNRHIEDMMPEDLVGEIFLYREEMKPVIDGAMETIKGLEELIKSDVVNFGATVKGTYLMATYNKGRVKWDTKALAGYAKAHPELLEFRGEGKPYASIKGI